MLVFIVGCCCWLLSLDGIVCHSCGCYQSLVAIVCDYCCFSLLVFIVGYYYCYLLLVVAVAAPCKFAVAVLILVLTLQHMEKTYLKHGWSLLSSKTVIKGLVGHGCRILRWQNLLSEGRTYKQSSLRRTKCFCQRQFGYVWVMIDDARLGDDAFTGTVQ